jgi:hypothetical protein
LREVGERDEVDPGVSLDGDERVPFDLPGFEQTGVGAGEHFVAIAGVGDKFERALGHGGDERVHHGKIESASGEDANGTICGDKALLGNDAPEARFEPAQEKDLGASHLWCDRGGIDAPERLERVADRANAGRSSGAQNGAQDLRKHVDVLVSVHVGEAQPVALQQGDLRSGFGFDFGGADTSGIEAFQVSAKRRIKSSGCAVDESGYAARVGSGCSVDEHNVTADAERGHGQRHVDRFFGACRPRHEGRASKDLSRMQFQDPAIDSRGHPEIVGIDDKTRHGNKLINPARKTLCYVADGAFGELSRAIRLAGMMEAGPVSGSHPKWAASSVG